MEIETIKRNNVILHEQLEDELKNKHSIGAFMILIEMGREFQFEYKNEGIGITHLNNQILLGDSSSSEFFPDAWSLIVKGKIKGEWFVDVWDQIKLVVIL